MHSLFILNKSIKSCMKKITFTGIVVAVISSFTGCLIIPKEEKVLEPPLKKPSQINYDTVPAKQGSIVKKISCIGTFVSTEQNNLVFKYRGGRLKKIQVKLGDTVKNGELLAELDTDDLEYRIKRQKIVLQKLQLAYDAAASINVPEYELKQKVLDIELGKLELDELKMEYEKAKLVSPMDGIVDYIHAVKEGQYVDAYQTIVRVANPKNVQLQYSDDKVSYFKLGMKPKINIDGRDYEGEVVLTSENVPQDADEFMKKSIEIRINNQPKEVKAGDIAGIELTLEKKDNVIVIPFALVREQAGQKYVQVLEKGIKKLRNIEVGIQTNTEVEVVKGLEEGEKVIEQ